MKQLNLNKLQNSLRTKFLKSKVNLIAPETIFFSKDTKIGKNVTIEPYVVIGSKVKIGNNVTIKSFSHLENCKIENKVEVGPYARIRPGTTLKEGSKIGNFVEVKKSIIGKKSKVNHLTYIGDTLIGKSTNIGAGTITCNYDGVKKSKTKIENSTLLKKFLVSKGHKFKSQTDTEVIVHLITENLKTENIVNSIKKTLKSLHGSFALGIIFKDQPDLIVGARSGSPLAVGYGPNENYLGSDSYALKAMTNKSNSDKDINKSQQHPKGFPGGPPPQY